MAGKGDTVQRGSKRHATELQQDHKNDRVQSQNSSDVGSVNKHCMIKTTQDLWSFLTRLPTNLSGKLREKEPSKSTLLQFVKPWPNI